jgi:GT2 family glycosyltransferase
LSDARKILHDKGLGAVSDRRRAGRREAPLGWRGACRAESGGRSASPCLNLIHSPDVTAPGHPLLSVVVPVHQGAERLAGPLAALAGSTLPRARWELVVVDDGSTDHTSVVAARWADVVVRLAGAPRGRAYARNRGFEAAHASVVVFMDPEYRVRPDTLERLVELFAADRELGAAVATLDPDAAAAGFGARFHHLLHHWAHRTGEAEVFWTGCAAVRRNAFRQAGGFDEWHYAGPAGEGLEFGRRLHRAGHRVVQSPDVRVAQAGRADLATLLRAEFAEHAVPRAWLFHHEREAAVAERSRGAAAPAAAIAAAPALALALAVIFHSVSAFAVALGSLAAVIYLHRGFYGFLRRRQGLWFAVRAFPLHLVYLGVEVAAALTGLVLHAFLGAPPAPPRVAARMGMEALPTWPPHPACPGSSVWTRPSADPPSATEASEPHDPRLVQSQV